MMLRGSGSPIRRLNQRIYKWVYPNVAFCREYIGRMKHFMTAEFGQPELNTVVVDVACGKRQPFLDYGPQYVVGADTSMQNLRDNKTCHAKVRCDFNHLPFKTGVASRVVSVDTIEHVKSPESGCQELVRILCADGRILIATPNLLSPKGLFIRMVPNALGDLIWTILRGGNLPYPHFYEANTLTRLDRLLGDEVRRSQTLQIEEDPLWFVDLPVFAVFLLYMRLMNSMSWTTGFRSYFVAVYRKLSCDPNDRRREA